MSKEVIITGANGLIGSFAKQELQKTYQIESFDISDPNKPVDITDKHSIAEAVSQSTAAAIVHFAAYTDVTGAWNQSGDKSGPAYKVNVLGTQNLVDACNKSGKHLIHISTSYVFDGEKTEPYNETDTVNPVEWYGETKALAEKYITDNSNNWTIFRIDQPFRPDPFAKADLPHAIIQQLKNGTLYPQFEDHYFGPTWIPDFVKIIEWAIRTSSQGLYHASSGESWTNYNYALEIAKIVGSSTEVKASKLADYLKSQARPYQKNTALNCSKLFAAIDFETISVKSALQQLEWEQ